MAGVYKHKHSLIRGNLKLKKHGSSTQDKRDGYFTDYYKNDKASMISVCFTFYIQ